VVVVVVVLVVVVLLLVGAGARTTVVVVDVEVVVVVVEAVMQAPHMLPGPAETPPAATHVRSSLAMRARVLVQSASVTHPSQALLLQTPASQVPPIVVQQTTAPDLPQVDSTAQRIIRTAVPALQPAFRSEMP